MGRYNPVHFFRRRLWLRKVSIEDVFPDFRTATVSIFHPSITTTGCRLVELVLFGYLAGAGDDVGFFEIGTSQGRTTRTVAINLGSRGYITSIDLAPGQQEAAQQMPSYQEQEFEQADATFLKSLPSMVEQKITLLRGNSMEYDFQEHVSRYDVVFIDGNHAKEAVLADAKTAVRLLRNEGGMMLFHDYLPGSVPSVVGAVHTISEQYPTVWLSGTKTAVSVLGTPRIYVNLEAFVN